jgi:excisionase family DNA binding protein
MSKPRELKTVNADEYLTSEEAADTLGIKPTAIRNYLHLGKFTTYKFKSLTLLDANEVQRWKSRQRG